MLLNTLRQSFLRTQISKNDVNSKVKADRKKTTSVFSFWLTAGENIDFVTQYLANNKIFGDDLVDFSCKVYLPINIRVKKIVIWHMF